MDTFTRRQSDRHIHIDTLTRTHSHGHIHTDTLTRTHSDIQTHTDINRPDKKSNTSETYESLLVLYSPIVQRDIGTFIFVRNLYGLEKVLDFV